MTVFFKPIWNSMFPDLGYACDIYIC
jgi:hypothetical protein